MTDRCLDRLRDENSLILSAMFRALSKALSCSDRGQGNAIFEEETDEAKSFQRLSALRLRRGGKFAMMCSPFLRGTLTSLQILVERLPADPKLTGHLGLTDTLGNPPAKLCDCRLRKGLFTSPIRAPLFGQGDPFPLALVDECPFKLGKGPHHR